MPRFWIICLGLWLGLSAYARAQPNVTGYAAMTAHLQTDVAHSPLIRVVSLGKSAGGRRDLWLVRVASSAADPAKTTRLLILCRQHGDEPASTEAVLGLIHRLASGGDPALRAELARITLYFMPMVNPDGAEANTRGNSVGADLNRDWGVFHQPETRAAARAIELLRPNLVIDAHNWDGGDEYNADCLEIPRATRTPLEQAAHALQRQAIRDLSACGYQVHPTAWGDDTDPRLAHRWIAHQNILSALVETHSGSPADVPDFQQRQGMYVALIHDLVRRSWAMPASSSRLDREAILFAPPSAPSGSRLLRVVHRLSFAWLWTIAVYGLALWGAGLTPANGRRGFALPGNILPRFASGYPSGTRKRDGTETRVRSGQRKAVSRPPR